jgi:hypothetical protein
MTQIQHHLTSIAGHQRIRSKFTLEILSLGILHYNAMEVGDTDFVQLHDMGHGLGINAMITAPTDKRVIVRIIDNAFVANPNNTLERRFPDKSTLEVVDEFNKRILYVRFLNRRAVRILGTFRSGDSAVIVDQAKITFGRGNALSGQCAGNFTKAGFKF